MTPPRAASARRVARREARLQSEAVAPLGFWQQAWSVAASDQISLVSAGCAFYAMLALFPALSLCITFYGMWFDLRTIEPQLALLNRLLPEESYALIAVRVQELVASPRQTPGLSTWIGGTIGLWSASSGIRGLLGALNLAHGQAEHRSVLAFYGTALMITLGAILAVTIGLGLLVALPTLLTLLGLPTRDAILVRGASFALLLCSVVLAISTLYRFGPARRPKHWRILSTGAVTATLLWAIASLLFSLYVGHFSSYDATYGALGAAVALLTWLYVSVYLILLGAELDAAIARNEARLDEG
ncbi:YihY/virulence factor BrkB family protein [Sediminicoccus sp. KRV36]|uniref:YihY/virulence factor BrkB family protein n=1 Tax=Sediminicoccus sp. KRV36 TaxID=3133721 RepID=UPI00200DB26D|nr:YihY/virulence factor BrkB family protein [Sediminicoccus rosea]UPY38799.1 YihY/virulence factor BrkB family protein [Sediminicoccus rosea]